VVKRTFAGLIYQYYTSQKLHQPRAPLLLELILLRII
jgi:hypothetical protein